MKYAKAISPDRRNATGRVNNPKKRSGPPIDSMMPAMPGSDVMGAVPPPGMMAAGNAISLAVPTCVNRNAATILRMLSRYGARDCQRATGLESFTGPPESDCLRRVRRAQPGGALEEQRAFARVTRERRRALELRPGLVRAAELGEEVAPHGRQEVIALER